MSRRAAAWTSRFWMIVPMMWATGASIAADIRMPASQTPSNTIALRDTQVLEEVLVEGRRPVRDSRKLTAWIDRLTGEFRYEGYVEWRGAVNGAMVRAEVRGGSRCVRFGKAVAVQCQINATWPEAQGINGADVPGGASPLSPAIAVFALDTSQLFIGDFQVDNNGIATGGKGWVLDDTLISKSPCADFPGRCERVLRLEAPPDGKVIRMRVDLERDGNVEASYNIQWIRLPQGSASTFLAAVTPVPSALTPAQGSKALMPPEVDSWLRRMVGQYRIRAPRPCRTARNASLTDELSCPEKRADVADATRKGPVEAQCEGIGTGPGVRCVMNMAWPETGVPANWRPSMKGNPGFTLYGYDPVQRGIAVMSVAPTATVGPGGFGVGHLVNGVLTSYPPNCAQPPLCNGIHRVSHAPNGEWIQFAGTSGSASGEFSLSLAHKLYRMQEGMADETARRPKAPSSRPPRGR